MPVIKQSGVVKSQRNFFYLFGEKEPGLTKAFAYILGENKDLLFCFLKEIGVKIRKTESSFKDMEIKTEHFHGEDGRTDIELKLRDKFHVIIKAKVGKNKVKEQKTQYLADFEDVPQKVMCFITQANEHKISPVDSIKFICINWIFVERLIDEKEFLKDPFVRDFQLYLRRYFITMKAQKEILVQDLSREMEIENYRNCNIYKRDVVFGSPLYFSPYFSRSSKQKEGEGIHYISKVLGIISCKCSEMDNFKEELESFCTDKTESERLELLRKWKRGISKYDEDYESTFFFLDNPIRLPGKALKDSSPRNQRGRGQGWIASMITPNRCITFADLLTHLK